MFKKIVLCQLRGLIVVAWTVDNTSTGLVAQKLIGVGETCKRSSKAS